MMKYLYALLLILPTTCYPVHAGVGDKYDCEMTKVIFVDWNQNVHELPNEEFKFMWGENEVTFEQAQDGIFDGYNIEPQEVKDWEEFSYQNNGQTLRYYDGAFGWSDIRFNTMLFRGGMQTIMARCEKA
jgi:hypothetical protein